MKRFLSTLVVLGLVSASSRSWASCRWFGTQLECELRGRPVSIGTQVAAQPRYAEALRIQPLDGGDRLFDEGAVGSWPLGLELQNVGTDPGLCWKLGEETYCH